MKPLAAKRLIVTADDFGLALPVNEAVELGHRNGILTAASLMVTAPEAADAIARARRLPRLGVGLHLVLVDGRPASPPEAVPALVGPDGRFHDDVLRAGVRIFCDPRARVQAMAEIRAQLAAFRRTGLALDHVNGHHHFHLHPAVQRILVALAPEFGIRAIRVPYEPFLASWRAASDRPVGRLASWLFRRGRAAAMKRRLDRAGLRYNDRVFGLNDSGHMRPERVRQFLAGLPDGATELYVHAATGRWGSRDPWPEGYEPEAEYAALIDPRNKALIAEASVTPAVFADLAPIAPLPAARRSRHATAVSSARP